MGKPGVHESKVGEGIDRVGRDDRLNRSCNAEEVHQGHDKSLAREKTPNGHPDHDAAHLKRQILLKGPGVCQDVPRLPLYFPYQEQDDEEPAKLLPPLLVGAHPRTHDQEAEKADPQEKQAV